MNLVVGSNSSYICIQLPFESDQVTKRLTRHTMAIKDIEGVDYHSSDSTHQYHLRYTRVLVSRLETEGTTPDLGSTCLFLATVPVSSSPYSGQSSCAHLLSSSSSSSIVYRSGTGCHRLQPPMMWCVVLLSPCIEIDNGTAYPPKGSLCRGSRDSAFPRHFH